MKAATAVSLAALCATMVTATPLDKRAYTTEIEMFTVTVTVTGYPPAPTPEESKAWGDWNQWHGEAPASTPAPTSEVPAPATTPDAPQAPPQGPPSEAPSPQGPPSGPPAPVSTSVSSDYQQGILDSHNMHRSNASVSGLVWDDHMASIAAQIAASCVYAHDTSTGGGGYGQNIGAGAEPQDIPAMITNQMYNDEIGFYPGYGSEPDMSNFELWGHYSQIVWKSTTGVGCATQHCPGGLANVGGNVAPYFTVCNYSPPGNFGGQYAANVLQPLGMPTVTL